MSLSGKTVVFSGFRNPDMETEIQALGGNVKTSVSNKTDIVVFTGKGTDGDKVSKGRELNKKVLELEEFKSMYLAKPSASPQVKPVASPVKPASPVKLASPVKPASPVKKATKDCPAGKVLNPKTGRCIKEKVPKEKAAKKEKAPKEKKATAAPKECAEGKVRNPATGRCVKAATAKKAPAAKKTAKAKAVASKVIRVPIDFTVTLLNDSKENKRSLVRKNAKAVIEWFKHHSLDQLHFFSEKLSIEELTNDGEIFSMDIVGEEKEFERVFEDQYAGRYNYSKEEKYMNLMDAILDPDDDGNYALEMDGKHYLVQGKLYNIELPEN